MGESDATYYIAFLLISLWGTDPWGTRTSQVLVRGLGWEPPLGFFDSYIQYFSHSGHLGLTEPGCGEEEEKKDKKGKPSPLVDQERSS